MDCSSLSLSERANLGQPLCLFLIHFSDQTRIGLHDHSRTVVVFKKMSFYQPFEQLFTSRYLIL